jgi:TRAP-type C4-dicarboxylate transport system permease small subunit
MNRFQRLVEGLAAIAGWSLLGLSILVVFESFARKFFGFSVQGTDEIGGYVLAVVTSVGFSYALVSRAHIRIDLVHKRLPELAQCLLNVLAFGLLFGLSGLLAWRAASVAIESFQLHAEAPTLLRTPLVWPQGVWAILMTVFAALSGWFLLSALRLLLTWRLREGAQIFGIATVEEELAEELKDVRRRQTEAGGQDD